MLDRGKFEEDWLSVSMLDAAGEFVPEVGEQGVELSLALIISLHNMKLIVPYEAGIAANT